MGRRFFALFCTLIKLPYKAVRKFVRYLYFEHGPILFVRLEDLLLPPKTGLTERQFLLMSRVLELTQRMSIDEKNELKPREYPWDLLSNIWDNYGFDPNLSCIPAEKRNLSSFWDGTHRLAYMIVNKKRDFIPLRLRIWNVTDGGIEAVKRKSGISEKVLDVLLKEYAEMLDGL